MITTKERNRTSFRVSRTGSASGSGEITSFSVGGIRIDALQIDEVVRHLLRSDGPRTVHLCNAYSIASGSKDPNLARSLNRSHLNLADGKPLVWIARRLGLDWMARRAYGPELMEITLASGRDSGTRHYLYGSTPEVLQSLQAKIHNTWPGAIVAGVESPPFRRVSDAELLESVERIANSQADLVWVGMGTPQQDELVERFAEIGHQCFIAIGAAFDFLPGTKRQAPKWMRENGLEWLFRLAAEPRRLWRRYLVGNLTFLALVARKKPFVLSEHVRPWPTQTNGSRLP